VDACGPGPSSGEWRGGIENSRHLKRMRLRKDAPVAAAPATCALKLLATGNCTSPINEIGAGTGPTSAFAQAKYFRNRRAATDLFGHQRGASEHPRPRPLLSLNSARRAALRCPASRAEGVHQNEAPRFDALTAAGDSKSGCSRGTRQSSSFGLL